MIQINEYNFGYIVINGHKYLSDVMIYPDGAVEEWWRSEGHTVNHDDILGVLSSEPEVLVLGTGATGMMKVPFAIYELCREKGINLVVETTADAVNVFNHRKKESRTAAGLHLTC